MIRRHRLEEGVLLEEQENQIVVKGKKAGKKLSWEETARQMAAEHENWNEWESAVATGLRIVRGNTRYRAMLDPRLSGGCALPQTGDRSPTGYFPASFRDEGKKEAHAV